MPIDEGSNSGPKPRAELIAAGLIPTALGGAGDRSGKSSDAVAKELWEIDEQISAIRRMQRDNAIGADELLAHCVTTWSRIKSLRQLLGTPRE